MLMASGVSYCYRIIAGCNGGALHLNYSPPVVNLMTEENGQAGEPGEEIVGDHPLEGEKTHVGNISEAGNVRHVRQSSHVQNCPTVVSVREASAADETEEEHDGGKHLLVQSKQGNVARQKAIRLVVDKKDFQIAFLLIFMRGEMRGTVRFS